MAVRALLAAVTVAIVMAACSPSHQSATTPTTRRSSASSRSAPPVTGASSKAPCPSSTPSTAGGAGKEVNPPGDIPDNQAFVAYRPPSGGYTLEVPEGWVRTDGTSSVSFTDKLNTIRVDIVDASTAPTVDSAKTDEVPKIASSSPCFHLVGESTVTRAAGPAVLVRYQASGPADPVTGRVLLDDVERYEFWRGGKEAVLTLSGPAGSDNVDPWKLVTSSFRWE